MKHSPSHKRSAACLAMAATAALLLTKQSPTGDSSAKAEAKAAPVLPAAGATYEPDPSTQMKQNTEVALPSVSVRGEIITAHLAAVPESVWQEAASAGPAYAVPAPSYPAFPHDPPAPGVPIIDSDLRPADALPPESPDK